MGGECAECFSQSDRERVDSDQMAVRTAERLLKVGYMASSDWLVSTTDIIGCENWLCVNARAA